MDTPFQPQSNVTEANVISNQPLQNAFYPERPSKKKKIIFAVAALVIVGLGVGGYVAYAHFAPDMTLKKAVSSLRTVKTYAYSSQLSLRVNDHFNELAAEGGTKENIEASYIDITGKVDATDSAHLLTEGTVSVSSPIAGSANIPSIDFKKIDTTQYVKLTDSVGMVSELIQRFVGVDVSNQWYKFDPEELIGVLHLQSLLDQLQVSQNQQSITDDQRKRILDAFNNRKVFSLTKTLASENIDGVSAHHYAYAISATNFSQFIDDVVTILGNDAVGSRTVNNIKKNIAEISNVTGEVWIGKKDHLFRKITFSVAPLADQVEKTGIESVNGVVTFTQYNADQHIVAPDNAKSIADIIQAQVDAAQEKDAELKRDDDNDGLTNIQEDLYKTDRNNPDTDGDGFLDGDEVHNGYDPLGPGRSSTPKPAKKLTIRVD